MKVENLPDVLPLGKITWSKMEEWKEIQEYEFNVTPSTMEYLSRHSNLKPGATKQRMPDGKETEWQDKFWMATGRDNFSSEYEHVKRTRNVPKELNTIPELLGIDYYYFNFNKQEPGGCSPLHVDSMSGYFVEKFKNEIPPEKQTELGRILVAIDDWEPGHFWAVGDIMWMNYKAGDMVYADVWNVQHGTGNASYNPRHTLLLDGIYSEEVVKLLMNNTFDINLDDKTIRTIPRSE